MELKRYNWQQLLSSDLAILAYISIIKLLIHFFTNNHYGFHRDEFLYIAMGKHLAWGYLELPPALGVISFLTQNLIGDSIFAIRLFPAVAGALLVFFSGLLARELGGGRFAQILAAGAALLSPAFLRSATLFQPVVFDQLYWVLGVFFLVKILKENKLKHWIALGLVSGIGLMNKYTMLLFGFGLFLGLLITPQRKLLLSKSPWLSAALAFVIFLPNLIWQYAHEFPFFDFIRVLSARQFVYVEPLGFLAGQLENNIHALPIWITGLLCLFFAKAFKPFRALGWMYLTYIAVLLFARGKAYYLLPAYPMLFAAGAVAIEKYIIEKRRVWLKPVLAGYMVLISFIAIPYGLPILPVEMLIRYAGFMADKVGFAGPLIWENAKRHDLPQDYADMFGWENQVATLARVYHSLSPEEKEQCVIFAANYGEAGAIEYFSKKYELPGAINVNGSFYTWGPGELPGDVLLTIGLRDDVLENWYQNVLQVATVTHRYARETNVAVHLARKPVTTLQEIWQQLEKYRF
ncbi:glycosyltransferase family 39 protein [candidate division KSB1 bacterium]|nr:glycosyltransferase family 39 protein [candidate division KSB1 bacterium]